MSIRLSIFIQPWRPQPATSNHRVIENAGVWPASLPHPQSSLLFAASRRGRFLLRLGLGLVGLCLLIGQILGGVLVRLRRRPIGGYRARIRSLRQPARSLFFRQRLQSIVQLLFEVVMHLLQVVHRHRYLLTCTAFPLLAGRNTRIDFLVGIGSVGEPRDDVAAGEFALLAIRDDRDGVVDDKRAPRWIERRWNVTTRRCRSLPTSATLCSSLLLLLRELRSYLFRDRLLHFRTQRHLAGIRRSCAVVPVVRGTLVGRSLIVSPCRIGIRVGSGCIRGLQIRGEQIIRQPECWRRIYRIGREISAVVAVPRRSTPTPAANPDAPGYSHPPRLIRPTVEARVVPEAGMPTVIGMAAVVVSAIDPGPIGAVVIVRTRIIGTAAARHVGMLHVAASAAVHDRRIVVYAHNRAIAMQTIVNLHSVAVDRADLPIRSNIRRSAAL